MGVPPTAGPPGGDASMTTELEQSPQNAPNAPGLSAFPPPMLSSSGDALSSTPMPSVSPMFPSTPSTPYAPSPPPTLKQPPPVQRGPNYQFPTVPGDSTPQQKQPPPTAKPQVPSTFTAPAPAPVPVPAPAPAVSVPKAGKLGPGGYKPSLEETEQAKKFCKYASSALDYDDVANAISNVLTALKMLTGKEVHL